MVAGFISRSKRRIKKRLPSGRVVIHYEKRKPNPPVCAVCKSPLHGVKTAVRGVKLAKSEKTVARPYGGKICGKCFRRLLKSAFRESMMPLISSET